MSSLGYWIGCRAYCAAHRVAKAALGRSPKPRVTFFHCYTPEDVERVLKFRDSWSAAGCPAVNDSESFPTSAESLFWGENVIDAPHQAVKGGMPAFRCDAYQSSEEAWRGFVDAARVPDGWRNSGLYAVCMARPNGQWALSSWVWTSAAVARYQVIKEDYAELSRIADALLSLQLPDGGWVVRHDFVGGRTTPMIAPNDSAYIADNAILSAYKATGEARYLEAAERCAEWVISTAQPDGLVYLGMDAFSGKWLKDSNIVDIGFTAALFARLYEITGKAGYRDFLERFCDAYVATFRNPENGTFATGVDGDRTRHGGTFARGQAWALEGLIPASSALGSSKLYDVCDAIARNLVAGQMRDGGWAYNMSAPLMGQDCKGVPVIALALARWGRLSGDSSATESARRALVWCKEHTPLSGPFAGGIFSYCLEGCVTHDYYSQAAFTYSSSYALEADALLKGSYFSEKVPSHG